MQYVSVCRVLQKFGNSLIFFDRTRKEIPETTTQAPLLLSLASLKEKLTPKTPPAPIPSTAEKYQDAQMAIFGLGTKAKITLLPKGCVSKA